MNESVAALPALDDPSKRELFGHPRGLFTLFMTEMWERATYYGMRAIMLLFMVATVREGGLGIDDRSANAIYGLYIAATYLFALWGGWVADRLVGQQRAIMGGAVLIVIGNAMLVVSNTLFFFVGLIFITFGTGLLKPNVSAIVAQLYPEGGARRDGGFSIFYMGINTGALVGQTLVPIIAVAYGWKLGFVVPALGMAFGLVQFWLGRKFLGAAGAEAVSAGGRWWGVWGLAGLAVLVTALGATGVIHFNPVRISSAANWAMLLVAAIYFIYLLFFAGLDRIERGRAVVMIALFVACIVFWAGYEQAGSSFTLFADRYTDRNVFGYEIPSGAVQSVNALFIILFSPLFGALWVWLGRRNLDPSAPFKFALGLIFLGLGFAVMLGAAHYVLAGQKVLPTWLTLTYLFHTFGELCLSPVGLSSMTKLSPPRFVGQVMGIWFLGAAIGNNLAGQLAGGIDQTNLATIPAQYTYLFWLAIASGGILILLTPLMKRLTAGAD